MKKPAAKESSSASDLISKRISDLGDWRGETLGRMRELIHEADPDVVEEWKWMGTPIFSHNGIICTGESYKSVVKLTFAKGASLKDPAHLFNSSLEGNTRRAIDIKEGEKVDAAAFKALVRQAIELNNAGKSKKPAKKAMKKVAEKSAKKVAKKTAPKVAKKTAKAPTAKTAKKAVKKSAKKSPKKAAKKTKS